MSEDNQLLIPLFDTGPEGARFRVENYNNELQRKHIEQRQESDLIVQADIFSVIHGTFTPDGPPGTLIVMDFRFVGSRAAKRRFKSAEIKVAFGLDQQTVGSDNDPIVSQIAPHGSFAIEEATKQDETTVSLSANVGTGIGLATLGIGAGLEKKTTVDTKRYTMLHGLQYITGRNKGEQNTARWLIWENEIAKNGIPGLIRTVILIQPRTNTRFKAEVTVKAQVDVLYSIRSVLGQQLVDPILFGMQSERKNMGPELEDVISSNLAALKLDTIGVTEVIRPSFTQYLVTNFLIAEARSSENEG